MEKGAYDAFRAAFAESNGSTWEAERDAVDFLRDDVVWALSKALGQKRGIRWPMVDRRATPTASTSSPSPSW